MTRTRNPHRHVSTAPPPVFNGGDRVIVDFQAVDNVYGLTKKQCIVSGLVVSVKGRFLATPHLASWEYVVRLDRHFCGEAIWCLRKELLTKEE